MTTRRTFLQRLASTIAAIALTPSLCRARDEIGIEQEESRKPVVMDWSLHPTSEITRELLDNIYLTLVREGAGIPL